MGTLNLNGKAGGDEFKAVGAAVGTFVGMPALLERTLPQTPTTSNLVHLLARRECGGTTPLSTGRHDGPQ